MVGGEDFDSKSDRRKRRGKRSRAFRPALCGFRRTRRRRTRKRASEERERERESRRERRLEKKKKKKEFESSIKIH